MISLNAHKLSPDEIYMNWNYLYIDDDDDNDNDFSENENDNNLWLLSNVLCFLVDKMCHISVSSNIICVPTSFVYVVSLNRVQYRDADIVKINFNTSESVQYSN